MTLKCSKAVLPLKTLSCISRIPQTQPWQCVPTWPSTGMCAYLCANLAINRMCLLGHQQDVPTWPSTGMCAYLCACLLGHQQDVPTWPSTGCAYLCANLAINRMCILGHQQECVPTCVPTWPSTGCAYLAINRMCLLGHQQDVPTWPSTGMCANLAINRSRLIYHVSTFSQQPLPLQPPFHLQHVFPINNTLNNMIICNTHAGHACNGGPAAVSRAHARSHTRCRHNGHLYLRCLAHSVRHSRPYPCGNDWEAAS